MSYVDFSSDAFIVAFFLYCFAFLFYVVTIAGKKWSNRDPEKHEKRWSRISFVTSTLGLIAHLTFFFTRWFGSGQIPTSNMYEFITFLGMAIMIAFTVVYAIYRKPLLGMFSLPLVVLVIAYASVFPQEVQPLIPALSSIWLKVHVTTAALGEAFFAVGFAAGMMYLIRVVDFKQTSKEARRDQFWVEFSLYTIVLVIGFIAVVFIFRGAGYEATFNQEKVTIDSKGVDHSSEDTTKYTLPPIVKPYNSQAVEMDSFLGMDKPLFEAPSWMNGINAGRKLNTVIWSVIAGSILYGIIRLLFRKRIGAVIHPLMGDIDPEDLDEISYRAIAIGFPIFTLGALIFAMIWANIAWGRFWGWDPKEVWALISWLYYSAYLHFRLSRGWQGKRSSWLAVIGFVVILFTLVGVNLVIAGLHSYAGV
ncbi:cytochrome c biogenesis protein CcsA [Paenibacillus glycanilyticus]|uniref:Cytochrome c biogenesis protein ResC n=1 Tax=Paenibacillus glycanilyticus TaxID=126569 RepID=A0ABQ6GEG8_9BACL|nr:cytochrome c biogenesis protein CcsA [Paenibacillus glycanilyticus]GLX69027.1 cytochrome c biogenesis protein ResC [Paenibacillus glycanilyticus]